MVAFPGQMIPDLHFVQRGGSPWLQSREVSLLLPKVLTFKKRFWLVSFYQTSIWVNATKKWGILVFYCLDSKRSAWGGHPSSLTTEPLLWKCGIKKPSIYNPKSNDKPCGWCTQFWNLLIWSEYRTPGLVYPNRTHNPTAPLPKSLHDKWLKTQDFEQHLSSAAG